MVLFFFSSRRRHTRCYRDWSSDVCSSDLEAPRVGLEPRQRLRLHAVLQELAFPEREALPGGELDFRWTLHRRIQAGDVQDRKSVVEGKRGECVGGRTAERRDRGQKARSGT